MLGGAPTPSIGFAMGLERLLLVMDQQGCAFPEPQRCTMYIGSMGEAASVRAMQLADGLRQEGFWAECDTVGRSVKAQMKYADKLGAKFSCILGDNELAAGKVTVKRMDSGAQAELTLDAGAFTRYVYHNPFEEIAESGPAPKLP